MVAPTMPAIKVAAMSPLPIRIVFPSPASPSTPAADDDVVAAGGEVGTGSVSQGNVEAAGGIVVERIDAIGRVAVAGCIFMKRTQTASRVEASLCIAVERRNTGGCVLGAGGVALERHQRRRPCCCRAMLLRSAA